MLAFLSLVSLMLPASVSAEQKTDFPNLFAAIAAGSSGESTVDQPEETGSSSATEDTQAIA
jgi:hypothetical protein